MDIDQQRRRDGAFFEDWSEWVTLGGPPLATRHPIGQRPTNMPYFYCSLKKYSQIIDGPAFEVAIPQDFVCSQLLRSVVGSREKPRAIGAKAVETWLIPSEEWQALRAVLPEIKSKITKDFQGFPR